MFRVAVVLGGKGVDANLRILQVLKDAWRTVERVAVTNRARNRRYEVWFSWEFAEGSVERAEELGVNIACRQAHQSRYKRLDRLPSTSYKRQSMLPSTGLPDRNREANRIFLDPIRIDPNRSESDRFSWV
ncbi:hypothetical protein Taro_015599 [Colocasia esculenta]|uniref:Uncharacterized protein n=1 Tax=Colocasia esculenta TaxID=4460 RepID=A0A843UBT3_COLES|nr:hypothetical protein [Colocasia esculenta]